MSQLRIGNVKEFNIRRSEVVKMSGSPIIDSILADLEAEGKIPKDRKEALVGGEIPYRLKIKKGAYKKKGARISG